MPLPAPRPAYQLKIGQWIVNSEARRDPKGRLAKRGTGHILKRRWNGYQQRSLQHPHFGPDVVEVLAIDVTQLLKT